MTTVILANLGSAGSLAEMKLFLKRMFLDKAIIAAPYPVRKMLSLLISNTRYKKSWEKYKLIGGSPLFSAMDSICADLQTALGKDYQVLAAYSYSEPQLSTCIKQLKAEGENNIIVLPLYPQASISTTGSIENEVKNLGVKLCGDFYIDPFFVDYWADLISVDLQKNAIPQAHLVFSAHSIPDNYVARGDKYVEKVFASAKAIAAKLGLTHSVCFQSRIGKLKWVEPDTKELLTELGNSHKQLMLVPIAFVNENLETLYDLDIEILPEMRKLYPQTQFVRTQIPASHPLLINCLKEKIYAIQS